MKKNFVLLILAAVLLVSAAVGAVIAAPENLAGKKLIKVMPLDIGILQQEDSAPTVSGRVIVPAPNFLNKISYWLKGCKSVRKMNDSAAYTCSSKTAEKLIASGKARQDRIFKIMDLEADAQINADDVWAQGIDGTGVNVAVLDTGIDQDHPELKDSIVICESFVEGISGCEDDHGHGTHVSGIITANGAYTDAKGVAPGAGIYMYKVCDAGGSCYESDMMAAMEAVVSTDAKVMSISIGGGNFVGENCDSDPLAAKVNWVASHGIAVAVASGNDRFFVSSPACASGAIAVGAVDKEGKMASFSNFGPALDIVAPGVSIYSPIIDGYASWNGTSMSAPHISGTVALMLDANPDLTVDEIKTALYKTADPINLADSVCYGVVKQAGPNYWIGVVPCTSDNYGAGIVNAYEAVNYQSGCTSSEDCDDNNECTNDWCDIVSSTCHNDILPDNTTCTNGICCEGICSSAICSVNADCDDNNACTIDTCNYAGYCNADCNYSPITQCVGGDGCCPAGCDLKNDSDCLEASCNNCFKGVCDDKCNLAKEDASCPDCP